MIVKDKAQPFIVDKKPHFKMYKSGKLWLTAMVTTLTLAGAGVTTVAHADENTTDANSSTAETKAGGNAVTSTTADPSASQENSNGGSSTHSVPVNIDHSQLDQAVQKAQDAGVVVNQTPTQSETVDQNQVNQKTQDIASDYNDQTQKINQKVDQYNHENENIKKYDNATADSTSLEDAVKQAQSTPGITVIKDNPKISNIQADDNSVDTWKNDAESDYSKQVSDINNAIATQNQNNEDYEQAINKLKQDQHLTGNISESNGGWIGVTWNYDFTWHYDPTNDTVVVTKLDGGLVDTGQTQPLKGGFHDAVIFTRPDAPLPFEPGSWVWKNGNGDMPGVNADYVWNKVKNDAFGGIIMGRDSNSTHGSLFNGSDFSPYVVHRSSDGKFYLAKELDRARGIGPQGSNQWGAAIPGQTQYPVWIEKKLQVVVNAPTRQTSTVHYHFDTAKLHHDPANETINYHYTNLNVTTTPTKQWTEDGQNSDNKVYFNGDTAHASVSANLNGINNYDGIKNGFALTDDYSMLAPDATVTGATVTENGKDATANYTLSVKDGKVTMTRNNTDGLQDGTYTLNVTFKLNDNVKAGTQLTNKGYLTIGDHQLDVTPKTVTTTTPDPHKDVDAGEVQGKGDSSINGQTVANGTLSTFPFTTANLPENRAKKISDRSYVDTLDSHLTYQGFKAYVVGDDGKLEDVTSHIKLVQNGQTLTFTEDSYLLDRYNADLSKAVTTPIIDVYAYVNGANVKIKNQYTLIQNGVKYTSNTVELTTPENPKPVKKDLNEQGVDINGKTVLPGSTNVYEITADYDQYKGIQTSQDNIAKGFYIIDDYPEDALNADTSKLSAKDKDGKPVDGLTYTIYQSVDSAPKEVQAAIKRSGMQIKGAFIVAAAKDTMDYFTKYVQTGDSVTVSMPMVVKDAYNGTYTNTAYEVDFGQGYATNLVSNNVPKLTPTKSAEDANGKALQNNATIQIGQTFDYDLHGAIIPANEGHPLTQYGFYDDYDQDHDQYDHKYQAVLTTDVTLKDGTLLKKGTDVSKYVKETVDETNGAVNYEFDKEFLDQVDTDKSAFGADIRAFFTRIAAGDVKNQYTNWINGKPYLSNTFVSHTPKPTPKPTPVTPKPTPKTPAPETPKPVVAAVTPAQPAPQKRALPQTGNQSTGLFGLGLMGLLMAIGSLGFGFKKKQKVD